MPYDPAPTGARRGARRSGQMMRKRSWFARFLALVALVAAVVAVIVVASNTNLHNDSNKGKGNGANHAKAHKKQPKKPRTKAKTYEVQSGDTLTSIAKKTGITVSELQALNPEVDPQTLIEGEVLKLQK
jgi:LysM repeat protein